MSSTSSPQLAAAKASVALFSDAYDTLKKIFVDAAALASIPKEQRDKYRTVLDETFMLIDSAILLVYNRLGDILITASEGNRDKTRNDVARELRRLANVEAWEKLNREVRLCRNLRQTSRDMNGLVNRLKSKLGIQDRNALQMIIDSVLEGEGRLADAIGVKLQSLSALAPMAKSDLKQVQNTLASARESLRSERMRFIKLQTDMYAAI